MIHFITTWLLPFIVVLGAAVILHEFGHFIVAKILKIRVETFSVGFGPRLFGKKVGHTDYRLSAIPLGGYVKLGGDESNAPIEGEGDTDIPADERFDLRPRWQRISVALAGPIMNILTALAIPLAAGLMYGIPSTPTPVVSSVAPGGAAEVAGLRPGDRIVSFNGNTNPDWETIRGDALLSPNDPLPLVVDRAGQQLNLTIKPKPLTIDGETAGLKGGDRIVAIGGQPAKSSEQVIQYIRAHKEEPLPIDVERAGQALQVTVRIPSGQSIIGVHIGQEVPYVRVGPVAATGYAIDANVRILRLTAKALAQVFQGKRSVRNTLSGPIGIARESSRVVSELGWTGMFTMLSFLSLNLGVFNLLPIPVLDGGAIFLLLIEGALAIVGMTISMRVRERIQQVGFVFVILLMVFVITNDIMKQVSISRGNSGDNPPAASPAPASPGK